MGDGNSPMSVGAEAALIEASRNLSQFGIAVPWPLSAFGFFKSLAGVPALLRELGAVDEAEGLTRHIGYLASKAACPPAAILGGEPFAAERKIILETLSNISATLRAALVNWSAEAPEGIPAIVSAVIRAAELRLEGKCSREKALFLARTVLAECPRVGVEIGVFGGRSIIPCAAAMRHNGAGFMFAVETWAPDATVANPTDDAPDASWSRVELPRVKHEFYRFVAAVDLTRQVRLVEARPGQAAMLFDQIDFLHVSGSQCVGKAAEAALLYASKVRRGGIVVLDGIDWTGAESGREILCDLCDELTTLTPKQAGMEDCALLRRR
jgi:predicted O-methyltransferase YrrM